MKTHTYYPRTSNFGLNDEIRIHIQQQDIYTLPGDSFIYIEGKFKPDAEGTGECVLTNNAYAFLFDLIRYEIGGVEVDRCTNPGITTAMKAYASFSESESRGLETAGWCPRTNNQVTFQDGKFSACIPLKFVLGVAEDYDKILMGVTQELILVRSRTDDNCYKNTQADGTKKATIEIDKVQWHMPHISVNDSTRLKLLNSLKSNKPIYIPFRKWELYTLPALRNTKTDIWPVKTSTYLEKPRYVLIAFQRNKKDNYKADASDFNHASITNLKLYLNSVMYPYDNMNINMDQKLYTVAYRMYTKFQSSYYNKPNQPLLNYDQYKDKTIFVLDTHRQDASIKSTTVDIKIELECLQAFNNDTTAFCLIIHDAIIEYEPLSSIVRKIV